MTPTIQSIDKFISSYKTIEISNLNNFSITNNATKIANYGYSNIELFVGRGQCNLSVGEIFNFNFVGGGSKQETNANFPQNKIIKTDEISTEIKTFIISKADKLGPISFSKYKTKYQDQIVSFLMQISDSNLKPINNVQNVYLQAYYTNDVKLKIRLTKVIWPRFMGCVGYPNWGNNDNLTFSNNSDYLNFTNKSNNPIKITIKPN